VSDNFMDTATMPHSIINKAMKRIAVMPYFQ